MLIYAIDDEKIALSELAEAIKTAFPNAEVVEILRPREALLRLQTEGERPELVFSHKDHICNGIRGLRA